MNDLLTTVYGSHLYGTNTPTSDLDFKVIYLPNFKDVLLGRKLQTLKVRKTFEGAPVANHEQMPANGIEVEYIPFQTFCRDYLDGQTYALEVAFACMRDGDCPDWVIELVKRFTTNNVSSMLGFAMKQTFDYVHRGERLETARRLKAALSRARDAIEQCNVRGDFPLLRFRMDTVMPNGRKVLRVVAEEAGLDTDTTVNNGKTMETLKFNGRDYLETTTLDDMTRAVNKLIDSYGHLTNMVAENVVDRKSLMHAVRVYNQAIELLKTGKMVFPRPEAPLLLRVKTELPLEQVKEMLLSLEKQAKSAKAVSSLPEKTPALEAAFEEWLLDELEVAYYLSPHA
jgi:hypothetical protein